MTSSPLEHFLGYFHQDWASDHANEASVVNDYVRREPDAWQLLPDIEKALREHPDELELASYLLSLGCEYRADWEGGTYRGWLEEVARYASAALKHKSA